MLLAKILQSSVFKIVIIGLATTIVILFIFALGLFVGYRKASFSLNWGENYHRNFGGPRNGLFGPFDGRDYIDAHGVFGQIIKIDSSTLVIKGQNNVERVILVNDGTTINKFQDTITSANLKTDDFIVVVGEPNNDGQIVAKLIRVLPPPRPGLPLRSIMPSQARI